MKKKNLDDIKPFLEALKVSIAFLSISIPLIYLSDKILLNHYIDNLDRYNKIQYYRPYTFMLLSSFIILYFVYSNLIRIKRYKDTINLNLKEISHKKIDLYQAECRMNNQKSLIDNIIKAASLLILNLDQDFNIKKIDGDLSLFTSIKSDAIMGKRLDQLFQTSVDMENLLNNKLKSIELKLISDNDADKYVLLDLELKHNGLKDQPRYTAVLMDITQRKELEDQVHYLDYYDPLTDLPNKVLLEIKYKSLKNNIDFKKSSLALLYVDVDDFKHINESFGHQTGDAFLIYIGRLLKSSISENHIISRITQDEFAIIMPNINSKDEIEDIIKDIYKKIRQTWEYEGNDYNTSVTIGISIAPFDGYNFEDLLKNAHLSCEYLKSHNKGTYQYYSKSQGVDVLNRLKIINELKTAIKKDEFVMYYQTVVDLKTYKIVGAEALVRWIHPDRGIVPPLEFIPIVENSNFTYEFMNLIVKKVLEQKREWNTKNLNIPKVSINISCKSFSQKGFNLFIEESIKEYGLKNEEIVLELTESGFTDNTTGIETNIQYLRNIGIEIAMDDFGTGYSTLSRLKELPIDYLKLDRSFILKMTKDSEEEIMVKSVISLAKTFGMRTLAEGIETKEQFNLLQDMGCDFGQGYYMSKPVPTEKLYSA